MVVGLPGNESPDGERFTLVYPKSENDVRLQGALGSQNPTGLPVGVVSADGVSGRKVSEEDEIYRYANSVDCMFICYEI